MPIRIVVALFALVFAASAHADFKRSYAKGLDAVNDARWDEVEARMKEALAEEGRPQANVKLYGMRFETYVPQYYLGLAAYKRGNCSEALRYWDAPGVEALVTADAKLAGTAQQAIRDCRGRRTVAQPTPEPPPTPRPATPVPTLAPTSLPIPTARPTLAPTPIAVPTPPPVAITPIPTPPQIVVPPELLSAVDAFLGGRYTQVLATNPARLTDPKARYYLFVVRAAAGFMAAQLDANASKSLLAQAEADVRGAKQLQPNATVDATIYSPRFRQFYSSVR